jgi:hypothetical protein
VLGGAMPGAPSSQIRLCGAEPPLEFVVVTVQPTSTVTVLGENELPCVAMVASPPSASGN